MIRFRIRRRERLGVAIGPDRIFAVRLGRRREPMAGEIWSRALPPYQPGGDWPELSAAFVALGEELTVSTARVHVALLPPLVQVKRVELPRLDEATLRQVLARDSARYFPVTGGQPVIGVSRLSDGRRSPLPYLVTAADAGLVASVFDAVTALGWEMDALVSGYSAWEAGARRLWPELTRESGYVIVSGDGRIEVLRLDRGRISLVRRFPGAAAGGASPEALVEDGSLALRPLGSPDELAAAAVGRSRGPELIPEPVRQERQARAARLSARLLACAAALLVLAAGLELWGAHRELAAVESRRAALHANVTRAMIVRDEMRGLDQRLHALAQAEGSRSQWAEALVNVAEHLPADAHLVGFRAGADSLVLEGEARHAGSVFESFQKAPGVLAVRADAPIRQEARDSGPAVERFTLAAVIASGQGPRGDPEASRAVGAPSQ